MNYNYFAILGWVTFVYWLFASSMSDQFLAGNTQAKLVFYFGFALVGVLTLTTAISAIIQAKKK